MMKASDMVLVDYDGNISQGKKVCSSTDTIPKTAMLNFKRLLSTQQGFISTLLFTKPIHILIRSAMRTVSTDAPGLRSENH